MKLGIIGLKGSGKKTVFEALTQNIAYSLNPGESRIGTIAVPDDRVNVLSGMYNPKKTIFAQVEYFLPGLPSGKKDRNMWNDVRDCDAFIHVVRNFSKFESEPPTPSADVLELEQEMIIADLLVVEKRLERLELDQKRGKQIEHEELSLLKECGKYLNDEKALRCFPYLAGAQILKGFSFISAKPVLILFNNDDEDESFPDGDEFFDQYDCIVIRGKLEHELAQLSENETEEFLSAFNIQASAMDRVIKKSYEILGLISFFTVGEDEVKAWTLKKGTEALDAADVIHSDIKKGFIRAETISYDDLIEAGSYQEAKKKGVVRLEGKTYRVRDGDIINFRFNV
jgi:GTP-binding protein YchF